MTMKIQYQTHSLRTILQLFGDQYEAQEGTGEITEVKIEAVDPVRDRVVFKIYLEVPEKK